VVGRICSLSSASGASVTLSSIAEFVIVDGSSSSPVNSNNSVLLVLRSGPQTAAAAAGASWQGVLCFAWRSTGEPQDVDIISSCVRSHRWFPSWEIQPGSSMGPLPSVVMLLGCQLLSNYSVITVVTVF
jgi:hypothetical protein